MSRIDDERKLHRPAKVSFPSGGEATIFAIACSSCERMFVPVSDAHLSVGAVDGLCAAHNGHALSYYAVMDDGEQVSGPMRVWAATAKARKDAVLQ